MSDQKTKAKSGRVSRTLNSLVSGDYVLATKYKDGDPRDHFVVGFFREKIDDRFMVDDSDGNTMRHNGFRRCEKISERVGTALVKAMPLIGDFDGRSLWYWRRHPSELEELCNTSR